MESQDETVTRIDVAERNEEIVQTTYRSKRHQIEIKTKTNGSEIKSRSTIRSKN